MILRLFKLETGRAVVQLNLQFEPRDLWVGAFWRISDSGIFHLYVCLLPLLPLHFLLLRKEASHA